MRLRNGHSMNYEDLTKEELVTELHRQRFRIHALEEFIRKDKNETVLSEKIQTNNVGILKFDSEAFQKMYKNHGAVMYIVDLSTLAIVDVNKAALEFYGYDFETMLTKRITDINITPEPEIRAEIKKAVKENRSYYVFKHKLSNGELRDIEVYANPIWINNKEYSFSIVHDITDRKIAEMALKKSETLLKEAQAVGKIGHWEYDFTAATQTWSQEIYNIFGLDSHKEAPSFLDHKDIIHKDDWPQFDEAIVNIRTHGTPINIQVRIRRSNTEIGWIHFMGIAEKSSAGNVIRMFGSLQDITKLKKAEIALAEEKERLLVTLKSIGDGVIATDTKGRLILINKVAEKLTGWTQSEAYGKDIKEVFKLINEKTRKTCENPVDKVLEAGEVIGLANHTTLIARDGTEKLIADSGAPIFNANHEIIGIVLVFRDITDQYKMEKQLQHAQKLESIGTLAGGIAHDFNNLLSVITGNISYALPLLRQDDEIYEVLTDVQESTIKAQTLTQQLLTFSKGGAPIKKLTDLNRLIEETSTFVTSGKKSRCEFDLRKDLWRIEIDPGQINQVISNLVINADQAMTEGGTIWIKTENFINDTAKPIPLCIGKYVKFSIQDQGIGILEKNLSDIFDPFYTTKPKGSGLGLSTAYSIIKRHDGYINVYSEVDKGTVFHVYLPTTMKNDSANNKRKEKIQKERGKILIMDDQESILKMACRILNRLGFKTSVAKDGQQAIDLYREVYNTENSFDLVILDLTVPGGMGGARTILELQQINPNIKAVVSSGYSNDPVMSDYKRYGFSGILSKPYSPKQISQILSQLLNKEQLIE